MQVTNFNRTLVRSLMAGVVLLGANACSRADRAESGSDNTAATMQDTAVSRATQDAPGTGQDRMATDTTIPTSQSTGTGPAAGDTAPARVQSNAPRAATASPSAERPDTAASAESGAAGYRSMQRDTSAQHESDSARVTKDTGDTSLNQDTSSVETAGASVTSDTATTDTASAAGYAAMARDTSGGVDQIGTTATAAVGSEVGDTTMNAGRVRPIEDSTETMVQVTTDTVNLATVAGDAAIGARGADTTENSGRIRPPEDSTEMQGNVSSAESASVNAADTADEAPVPTEVRESASDSPTDAVGAAALGGTITGSDAVAMMTRGGEQCNVLDPETDEEVRWDMSSTPITLNPCGLGSMNLSKVWTKLRGSGAAGQ